MGSKLPSGMEVGALGPCPIRLKEPKNVHLSESNAASLKEPVFVYSSTHKLSLSGVRMFSPMTVMPSGVLVVIATAAERSIGVLTVLTSNIRPS